MSTGVLAHEGPSGVEEEVILLDDHGQPIGKADKYVIHTDDTPLHLAFSCYVFNQDGDVLVTRRALSKLTWPGVWTNSVCGHPAPDEPRENAVHRRAAQELGTDIRDLRVVLPDFQYRAVDASGVVENEVCPVYIATIASEVNANPDEVAQWEWVSVPALVEAVRLTPFAFSPWMVLQIPLLGEELEAAAEVARSAARESGTS